MPENISESPNLERKLPAASEIEDTPITETHRSGSITGIGIILGFSLTFVANWSFGPGRWELRYFIAMVIALLGIICQLVALFIMLRLPPLKLKKHQITIRMFAGGVGLVLSGFILRVLFDLITQIHEH